jgi:tRNA C32,U32 (ribose-2'-O)-methylase TrmJ
LKNTKNQAVYGRKAPPAGETPSVILINPKKARNVAMALRTCAAFGFKQLWYTGDRVSMDVASGERLPREERMKGYQKVELRQFDYPFDMFPNATPVAVEVREHAEPLTTFEHPENPVYVFGPEDGGLTRVQLLHCHRFVVIPTMHCLNLATALTVVLYDRMLKGNPEGFELDEDRGFINEIEDLIDD